MVELLELTPEELEAWFFARVRLDEKQEEFRRRQQQRGG